MEKIKKKSMEKEKGIVKEMNPLDFDKMITKLRGFFIANNYVETFPQPQLSILAACEDPKTVRSFIFNGEVWPLPQTNQMHLERILMTNSETIDGLYCLTASYRDEPNPIEGRHLKSFEMFEAEHKGDFSSMIETLSKLMVHLGLSKKESDIPFFKYNDLCEHYGVEFLESEHEGLMWKEFGDVVGLTHFPRRTSPFFNMKFDSYDEKTGEGLYRKCDLIICGQETFGCAERSCDVQEMESSFLTISDGQYSKLLFEKFGRNRVNEELEIFLSHPMIERWGFGSGLSRLHRSMKIKGLL